MCMLCSSDDDGIGSDIEGGDVCDVNSTFGDDSEGEGEEEGR